MFRGVRKIKIPNRHNKLLRILVLLSFAAIMTISGCKKTQLPSTWTATPIVIDGNIDDWSDKPTTYFEGQDMMAAFCNDSTNLYLHFRSRNFMTASLIRKTGITIYIDKQGKNKKDFFVRLNDGPVKPISPRSVRNEDEEKKKPGFGRQFQSNSRDIPPRLTCKIKDRIVEKIIPFDGSQGPTAAYDTSFGFYSYEIAVPLDYGSVLYFGLDVDLGQEISIGAEWGDMGDMKKSARSGGRSGMKGGGGRAGGGKGGRGGRSGEGRGMEGGPSRNKMPEKQEIWANVILVEPQ
jgi:uncharacterized membrane protein YgcG